MDSIRAAVLREYENLEVEQIQLTGPGSGEVLVDLEASGVCHTDYHFYAGEHDVPLPVVLGHEGAGTVSEVGKGVTHVEPGDRVVLSLLPSCGHCRFCAAGRQYLCPEALDIRFEGTLPNGRRHLQNSDGPINHFYAQSSFATAAVVTAESVVPIEASVAMDVAASFGCGATTGVGAVLNTANIDAGDRVAIFGCGGTGMSAIIAATAAGASEVVAIDVEQEKLELARNLGATVTINSSETGPVPRLKEIGNIDYTFEFVGHSNTVRQQAIDSVERGGTVVLSGAATEDASGNLQSVIGQGKTVVGNVAGSVSPFYDIPRFVRMVADGVLDLEPLIERYHISEVETAFDDLINGVVIKPVLDCS